MIVVRKNILVAASERERVRDREKRDRAKYDKVVTSFKSESAVVLSPLI